MKVPQLFIGSIYLSLAIGLTPAGLAVNQIALNTPAQVTHARVESKTDNSVTLKWKNQSDTLRYQVRVMKSDDTLVKKHWTKKHALVIENLNPDTAYRFKVRGQIGKKSQGEFGDYSNIVKVRTESSPVEVIEDTADEEDSTDNGASNDSATDPNDSNTDDSSTTDPIDDSSDDDSTTDDTIDETDPDDVELPDPILIGFWGLNGYISETGLADVQDRFHSTVFQVAQSGVNYTVNTFLPLVKASGMKVTLRLTGGHSVYTTSGNFDLTKWKTALAAWQVSGSQPHDIQPYIDDGTIVGHMLIDDVNTFTGTDPTAADLEEMARYSEELFPGMMTYVRLKCSDMPVPTTNGGQYVSVDNCDSQYTNYPGFSDGPIADYVVDEPAAATALGLGFIGGLNIADGGDGSSGQHGTTSTKYAMTAAEITEYGEALLAVPNIQMLLLWEYDGNDTAWVNTTYPYGDQYFNEDDLEAALTGLGEVAAVGGVAD